MMTADLRFAKSGSERMEKLPGTDFCGREHILNDCSNAVSHRRFHVTDQHEGDN
jgi:hypothetical protein